MISRREAVTWGPVYCQLDCKPLEDKRVFSLWEFWAQCVPQGVWLLSVGLSPPSSLPTKPVDLAQITHCHFFYIRATCKDK